MKIFAKIKRNISLKCEIRFNPWKVHNVKY